MNDELLDEIHGHGYIYLFVNENNPNEIKIGLSQDPIRRRKELHTTSTPLPMYIKYIWAVRNMREAEKVAHYRMRGHRINDRREFFNIVTDEAALELETPHQHFGGHDLADIYLDRLRELIEDDWECCGIYYESKDLSEFFENQYFARIMNDKYNSF
ncbi:TPA: GIY-YIG nuclease family protein [Vibrio parahaemolyticus]|nr:GIY-YIG nuclease family protein [Vibrio vulnificus]EIO4082513.1 GIY-YIG nuclease family protein [Vibrio parahaemolyticus]MCU8440796.1 GIY-YIG nuclease family protein [Vibrio vulnificus]MDF4611652.1 GIY-YIG nuclease family protein [Vibrio parahaemolyticus]